MLSGSVHLPHHVMAKTRQDKTRQDTHPQVGRLITKSRELVNVRLEQVAGLGLVAHARLQLGTLGAVLPCPNDVAAHGRHLQELDEKSNQHITRTIRVHPFISAACTYPGLEGHGSRHADEGRSKRHGEAGALHAWLGSLGWEEEG